MTKVRPEYSTYIKFWKDKKLRKEQHILATHAILGLLMFSETGLINDHMVKEPLGSCALNMTEFHIWFEGVKGVSMTSVLNLNKDNYKGMKTELATMNWEIRSYVTMLGNIISEASNEAMLFYSAWNLYCLVRY
eukprot:g27237.t1